jgi:hypothetical protein
VDEDGPGSSFLGVLVLTPAKLITLCSDIFLLLEGEGELVEL